MELKGQATKTHSNMLKEVLDGLQKPQKMLSSKYFYDRRGSELFEQICNLDEYYPTRTELSIMRENICEITEQLGSNIQLIELGSGSSLKTRLLLDNLQGVRSYVPVDISNDFLKDVMENLRREYPALNMTPVAADYTQPFNLPYMDSEIRRIVFYPGSTIGNFTKERAKEFISVIAEQVGANGGLLIGFDLLKDRDTLIAAYDDSRGVTAEFNKNILLRINRELDANFKPDAFEHKVVFNEEKSRIEMLLESSRPQAVDISGTQILFAKGETIHTENSHKYSLESIKEITAPHFKAVHTWTDKDHNFAVQFLVK